MLDEDGYAAADLQDLTRKRFIKAWDALIDGYKDTFSEANYRLFIGLVLDVLLRPWEKYVMGLKYTEVRMRSFVDSAVRRRLIFVLD